MSGAVVPVYASRAFPGPDAAAFVASGDVVLVRVERDYGAGNWTAFATDAMPDALRQVGVRPVPHVAGRNDDELTGLLFFFSLTRSKRAGFNTRSCA